MRRDEEEEEVPRGSLEGESGEELKVFGGTGVGGGRDTDGSAWKLSEGPNDSRAFLRHIDFPAPFDAQPQVAVFLSSVHIKNKTDRRVCVSVERQNKQGFELSIATWNDSRVLSATASWVAFDSRFLSTRGSVIEIGRLLISAKSQGTSYKLHKGKGDRTFSTRVLFKSPHFSTPPSVVVGLSAYDILNDDDHRLALSFDNVDTKGFNLNVSTWLDTLVWSLEVTWIAFDNSFLSGTQGHQIASGRWPFKRSSPGYGLHEGTGERWAKQTVALPRKFSTVPTVVPFFSLIDVIKDPDHRIRTALGNQTDSTFELKLGTWGNSQVWSASCSFLAFGNPVGYAGGKTSAPASTGGSAKLKSSTPTPSDSTSTSTSTATSSSSSSSSSPSSVALPASGGEEEDFEKMCKVCMDADINICFVPCGHLAVCQACADLLMKKGNKRECPICKAKITKAVRIYKT